MKKLFLFISLFTALQVASAEMLTITFLDSESSSPIEGVSGFIDFINNNTPSVPIHFVSDANGMVEVADFPEGLANLWASAVGYSEVYMFFSFPEESDLVIAMSSGSTNNVNDTLNIQVLDSETGDSIEGVNGSVFSTSFWDFLLTFNTDQDGLATLFDFPTGQTEIWASAFGYEDLYHVFDFIGEDLVLLEMNPSGTTNDETDTLSIYVIDSETGTPIQNVNGFINSYATWGMPFQFVTDASGMVEIHNFPYGSAELHANAYGYYDIIMSFTFPEQDHLIIEMSPHETSPFETDTLKIVFVNSETGDIIPNVEGYAMSFGTWDMVYTYEFMSNELGYAEVYNFPLGLAEVYAFKIGFADSYQYFEFTGDESANLPGDIDVITIQMDPVGPPDYDSDTLTVHFMDAATGQPVRNVTGYLMSNVGNDWNGYWSATFYSDDQGIAVIPMAPYGNIEIYGSCFGYLDHYSSISFSSQSEFEIIMYPIEQITNATFSGIVTVPEGSQSFFPPIVFAASMDSSQVTFQNFVDQSGNYTLPVLSGEYQIGAITLLSGGASLGLQMQFYDNASTVYDATQISIADGELIENINFVFTSEDIVLNADYGSMVMGQVGNDDGASMENTIITVKNENGMTITEGTVNTSQMYMLSGLDQNQLYFISASNDLYGTIEEVFTSSSMMSVKNFQFSSGQLATDKDPDQIPNDFTLEQNFPNPFNPVTTIRYTVSDQQQINISVYDIRGNLVKNLLNSIQWPGVKMVQWDATDNYGAAVSAGVYLYKIKAGTFSETKKMILLK